MHTSHAHNLYCCVGSLGKASLEMGSVWLFKMRFQMHAVLSMYDPAIVDETEGSDCRTKLWVPVRCGAQAHSLETGLGRYN